METPALAPLDEFEAAFRRHLPDLIALQPEEVIQLNLGVRTLVSTILGALPRIRDLRDEAADLKGVDVALFDKLESLALALSHADTLCSIAPASAGQLPALIEQALPIRSRLRSVAESLIGYGLIESNGLDGYIGRIGYRNIADDLHLLSSLLKAHWSDIEGKCPTPYEELELAASLSARILREAGSRKRSPDEVARAADLRARAYTLLLRSYDTVRRAMAFLRWQEGDANEIAPSPYAGRNRKNAAKEQAPEEIDTAPEENQKPSDPAADRGLTNAANQTRPHQLQRIPEHEASQCC